MNEGLVNSRALTSAKDRNEAHIRYWGKIPLRLALKILKEFLGMNKQYFIPSVDDHFTQCSCHQCSRLQCVSFHILILRVIDQLRYPHFINVEIPFCGDHISIEYKSE